VGSTNETKNFMSQARAINIGWVEELSRMRQLGITTFQKTDTLCPCFRNGVIYENSIPLQAKTNQTDYYIIICKYARELRFQNTAFRNTLYMIPNRATNMFQLFGSSLRSVIKKGTNISNQTRVAIPRNLDHS